MTGLQLRQVTALVLVALAALWLFSGSPAAPVVHGVRSEPVFIVSVVLLVWWVVRGGG